MILYFSIGYKNTFRIALFCIISVLFIYILPFFLKDPTIFFSGYKSYTSGTLSEWSGQFWQAPGDKPIQLFSGVGFASYFYEFLNGDLLNKINILKIFHLISSSLVIVILAFIFYKYKNRIDYRIYSLGTLKIYFVFFYNFIQIPYIYLFTVPIYVSIFIITLASINPKLKGLECV